MKHFANLIVLAGTLCLAAHAAEPPAELVLTFKDSTPVQTRGIISTDLRPAPVTGAVPQVQPAPLAASGDANASGLPAIAAAGPAVSVPVSAALTPGAPLKTYATLKDAADAGIDPLRVSAGDDAAPSPEPVAAPVTRWAATRAWIEVHQLLLVQGVGGTMVLLMAVLFWTRRRAARR